MSSGKHMFWACSWAAVLLPSDIILSSPEIGYRTGCTPWCLNVLIWAAVALCLFAYELTFQLFFFGWLFLAQHSIEFIWITGTVLLCSCVGLVHCMDYILWGFLKPICFFNMELKLLPYLTFSLPVSLDLNPIQHGRWWIGFVWLLSSCHIISLDNINWCLILCYGFETNWQKGLILKWGSDCQELTHQRSQVQRLVSVFQNIVSRQTQLTCHNQWFRRIVIILCCCFLMFAVVIWL